MQTEILSADQIQRAAEILQSGGTVVFPTETVYGLGANALDASAAAKIFSAKGRPTDNPLIVHIADINDMEKYADVNDIAIKLAQVFMPGALSLILPKRDCIPNIVSGGLSSIALRFPSHPTTQTLIHASGLPVAAPSANLSGRPSPTTFAHAYEDMNGRVNAIIDGGDCEIGMESTVLSLLNDKPVLLRPGGVTPEMLRSVLGKDGLEIAPSLLNKTDETEPVLSPGMKYRHYAPKAPVYLLTGLEDNIIAYLQKKQTHPTAGILCWDEDLIRLHPFSTIITYGSRYNQTEQAHRLFSALREFDSLGVTKIYARMPAEDGIGLAILNRLLRAAGFEKLEV